MRKIFLLFVLCLQVLHTDAQINPTLDARLQHILDSVCLRYNIKGASAAVLIPGMGTWKGAYGVSAAGQPLQTNMLLGIGSNTKSFIASTLLKMQEQNLLDLDDTTGSWIPPHPYISGQITIRQLLSHRSGLYNYTNSAALNNAINSDFTAIWTPAQILPYVQAPIFAPGAGWDYCNTNYLLAGMIISQVSGQPLATTLQQYIFTPNQLNHTYLYPDQTPNDTIARIWSIYFVQPYLEEIISAYGYNHNAVMSMAGAAGGIISTAEDNVQFWHNWFSGQIINNTSMSEMQTYTPIGGNRYYGLGLFRIAGFNGRVVFSHGGTNLGFINENIVDSINGTCISVMTNQDSIGNGIILNQVVKALHQATLQATDVRSALQASAIRIYPNPVRDMVTVTSKGVPVSVQIFDLKGTEVAHSAIDDTHIIDLKGVAPGVYSILITDKVGTIQRREKLMVVR